jgi:hypothetical protein
VEDNTKNPPETCLILNRRLNFCEKIEICWSTNLLNNFKFYADAGTGSKAVTSLTLLPQELRQTINAENKNCTLRG